MIKKCISIRPVRFIAALILLLFISAISLVFSNAGSSRIYKSAGYDIGNSAVAEQALSCAEDSIGVKLRVYINDVTASGELRVGENTVISRLGLSNEDDIVILLIDDFGEASREYKLLTYGRGYDILSDEGVSNILDDATVYRELKRGNISEGIVRFSDLLVKEVEAKREQDKRSVIFATVVIAIASAGGSVGFVVYKYKKKLKAPIYPLSKYARLDLSLSRDDFITSFVTRTKITSSSSGGGGGRRGGSRGRR